MNQVMYEIIAIIWVEVLIIVCLLAAIWFYRQAFKDSQREQKYYKERYYFVVNQLHSKEHKLEQIRLLLGDNK